MVTGNLTIEGAVHGYQVWKRTAVIQNPAVLLDHRIRYHLRAGHPSRMDDDSLTAVRLIVLLLCTFWSFDFEGIVPFSRARIAEALQMSFSTVKASLQWLHQKGYISIWEGRLPGVRSRNDMHCLIRVHLSNPVTILGIRRPYDSPPVGRYIEVYSSLVSKVAKGALSPKEFMAYLALLFWTKTFTGRAFPEVATLAKDLGVGTPEMADLLRNLEHKQMIRSFITQRVKSHKTQGQVWVLTPQWRNDACPVPAPLRPQEEAIVQYLGDPANRAMIVQYPNH